MSVSSTYLLGNSKSIKSIFSLNKLPSPNLIISSPPYYDVLNYNNHSEQIGFGQDQYQEYLNDVCKIFQDCYDLSQDNSSFWLVVDSFKKDGELKSLPFDIVNQLKAINSVTWKLREVIIWDKEKNLPWNGKGHFKNQFEYILFLTKGEEFRFSVDEVREVNDLKKWWKSYPERYNESGKAPSNLWNFTTPIRGWGNSKQNHLCPFPFPLVEKILSISSVENDIVLDPFAGSGSVLAISELMDRNAIGIDINVEYKNLYESEVIEGAKVYWAKRVSELEHNRTYIENFTLTNRVLRVHKVTGHISEFLYETKPAGSYKYLILTISEDQSYIIYVVTDKPKKFFIGEYPDELKKLLKQCKVKHQIIPIKDKDLIESTNLKSIKLYKFNKSKIYSFSTPINYKSLNKKTTIIESGTFYSIFSLKLK